MKNYHAKRTFTLIETLIVILIIGILAAALVPRIMNTQERARDITRVIKIRNTANAIDLYAQDHDSQYPLAAFYTYSPSRKIELASSETKVSLLKQNIKDLFSFIPSTFAASEYSTIAMIGSKITPYIAAIPTDNKGTIAYADGSCEMTGDSFGYFTDGSGAKYAITANMEAKQGNTTNCVGLIDKEKQGGFQVVGKGLIDITNPTETTICDLQNNPNTYLNTAIIVEGVLVQSGSVLPGHGPVSFSLDNDCVINISPWLTTALRSCPPGRTCPPTIYNFVNKFLHLQGVLSQDSVNGFIINNVNNVTEIQ